MIRSSAATAAALLAAALVCAACAAGPLPGRSTAGTGDAGGDGGATVAFSEIAAAVVVEGNRQRGAAGARSLAADPALHEAAQSHAEELAARRVLDHASTAPGRTTMTDRIGAAGGTWVRAAENLASMTGTAGGVPARTIAMWLDSPGHRRNLLDPAYTHTGAGVAVDARGMWYVVQLYTVPAAR